MNREVRRVPVNWIHPTYIEVHTGNVRFWPLFDRFSDAFAKWLTDFDRIRAGVLTDVERECYPCGLVDWLLDEGIPPNPYNYMPDWPDEERTHFMMYETTSKGTPVSPAFLTPEELARWLTATNAHIFARDTTSYDVWLRIAKGDNTLSAIVGHPKKSD